MGWWYIQIEIFEVPLGLDRDNINAIPTSKALVRCRFESSFYFYGYKLSEVTVISALRSFSQRHVVGLIDVPPQTHPIGPYSPYHSGYLS